jgi:hypothetical protein
MCPMISSIHQFLLLLLLLVTWLMDPTWAVCGSSSLLFKFAASNRFCASSMRMSLGTSRFSQNLASYAHGLFLCSSHGLTSCCLGELMVYLPRYFGFRLQITNLNFLRGPGTAPAPEIHLTCKGDCPPVFADCLGSRLDPFVNPLPIFPGLMENDRLTVSYHCS